MSDIARKLCLTDRKELNIDGVKEVISFDESEVVTATENGELRIEGEGLRISNLNTTSGEIRVTGRIDLMEYSREISENKKGIRARLFG